MQPNYSYSNQANPVGRWLKLIVGFIVLLILVLAGIGINQSLKFHIVKTDPELSAMPTVATDMTVYTNKELAPGSLQLYDPGGVISKSRVSSKTIVLTFRLPLQDGRNYEFFIKTVKSVSGATLTNQSIAFTAQNILLDNLSPAQQKKALANQDKYAYSVQSITFTGFDNLSDQGLTAGEVLDVQTNIFNYSNLLKRHFVSAALNPATLVVHFQDPASRRPDDSSATFALTIDGSNFTVRTEYDGIADVTYTRIFDAGGALVYDSSAQ